MISPESQRPRKLSWTIFGGKRRKLTFEDERLKRPGKKRAARFGGIVLVCVALVMSGIWVFGGPMPMVPINMNINLNLTEWKPNVPDVNWTKWSIDEFIDQKWKVNQKVKLEKVKEWIPNMMKRAADMWNGGVKSRSETNGEQDKLSVVVVATHSSSINPELKSFGVETLAKVTRKAVSIPTAKAVARESETILGHPVARNDDGAAQTGKQEVLRNEIVEDSQGEVEVDSHPERVVEMWKKHAEVLLDNEEHGISKTAASSVAGTLAEGISPSTES